MIQYYGVQGGCAGYLLFTLIHQFTLLTFILLHTLNYCLILQSFLTFTQSHKRYSHEQFQHLDKGRGSVRVL